VNNVQGFPAFAGTGTAPAGFRVQDSGTWQSGTPFGVPPARVPGYGFRVKDPP